MSWNLCEEAVVGRGAGAVGAHPGEGGVEGELMGSATRQRKKGAKIYMGSTFMARNEKKE